MSRLNLRQGQDTLMPNWALDAMEHLTLAADLRLLIFLTRHRAYRANAFSTRQLAIALEIDLRTVQASAVRLAQLGLILSAEGRHCSAEASSRVRPTTKTAQASRKAAASPLQKDSRREVENAVPDEDFSPLNKGTDELMKASYASRATGAGEPASGLATQADGTGQPMGVTAQGADAPAAGAATPDLQTPVQVEPAGLANGTTSTPTRGSNEAGRAAPPTDEAALHFFHGLAGYGFTANHRLHLARWFGDYSQAFLRLAWRLAPTLPGVKVPAVGFVWLLNREKEWPEALRSHYERELSAVAQPVATAGAPRVVAGDLLRWVNGATATVQRVDSAFAVTDAEDDRLAYVPLTQLGQGVEVLRS